MIVIGIQNIQNCHKERACVDFGHERGCHWLNNSVRNSIIILLARICAIKLFDYSYFGSASTSKNIVNFFYHKNIPKYISYSSIFKKNGVNKEKSMNKNWINVKKRINRKEGRN